MEIKQFYDKSLAHASYAILSENEIALIDPARDPGIYFDFADDNNAEIKAIIETHPHADFVSSHLEISKKTGAPIYISKLVNALYDHITFDEGDELSLGIIKLFPINTPGHSPDSISIIIKDKDGKDHAIATGDTLFVGDVGRPDLRESAGSINKTKDELARMMYNTINEKLLTLNDDVLVYPAHGAGSLCGKSTSTENSSTIGKERKSNYALQPMSEDKFVDELLNEQSYIPKYFGYDVELNRKGAPDFEESVNNVKIISSYNDIEDGHIIIDTRSKEDFENGHYPGAVNLREDTKFETYLGTVVSPDEKFYLISDSKEKLDTLIRRCAKIGYELIIEGALVHEEIEDSVKVEKLDLNDFKENLSEFTIVDVRNLSERNSEKIFEDSIHIPLNEIRERYNEIPSDKPVVVHCAAGYRSAAASSILRDKLDTRVFDLSDEIKNFSKYN